MEHEKHVWNHQPAVEPPKERTFETEGPDVCPPSIYFLKLLITWPDIC